MSQIIPLFPRQMVPALEVPTVNGNVWRPSDQKPENFLLIVFYRGYHCPICSKQLRELDNRLEDFRSRGVSVFALSSDNEKRARMARDNWRLEHLTIGYGLSLGKAREWGLYISSSRGKTSTGVEEPALFSEPGQFLINPDGTLFFASVQTMPFARPHVEDILGAIDYVLKNNYPARGEVVDHNQLNA